MSRQTGRATHQYFNVGGLVPVRFQATRNLAETGCQVTPFPHRCVGTLNIVTLTLL